MKAFRPENACVEGGAASTREVEGRVDDPTDGCLARVLAVWCVLAANGLFLGLLGLAIRWRETPEFWLHTGGYPVLLRESVLYGFYPLYGLTWLLALGSLLSLVRCRRSAPRLVGGALALGWLQVMVLGGLSAWAFANNLAGLLE